MVAQAGGRGLAGQCAGGLAGGAHGDVFAGFGDKHVTAENSGDDVAGGFYLRAAANEQEAGGFLSGGRFRSHSNHGMSNCAGMGLVEPGF